MSALPLTGLAKAALAYALELGWAVFPLHSIHHGRCSCGRACASAGKHPRTLHGVKDATMAADVVTAWWTKWPTANIGVATGQVSGIVAIDVDGPDGEAALQAICGNPPTATSLTGKGRHAIFRAPETPIQNRVALAPHVDVRADGGYIVVPPSRHQSGRQYRWDRERGLGPRECPPAPLPHALLERLRQGTVPTDAVTIPSRPVIGEGERNHTLTSYAGRLLAKGHPPREVLELVSALNTAKCRPPLAHAEVHQIVSSVAGREARKRGHLELVEHEHEGIDATVWVDEQVTKARELNDQDYRTAPTWGWTDLHNLTGPLVPGQLWTIGARPGQGKTTLLLNWVEYLTTMREMPWLFVGMEMDAAQLRRKWAAWRCSLDEEDVLAGDWDKLPIGARAKLERDLDEQAAHPLRDIAHFAPARSVDLDSLRQLAQIAQDRACRVVVIDHFHRLDFGSPGADHLAVMARAVQEIKELAITLELVVVMAAQLNRPPRDVFGPYRTPPLSSLAYCGKIEQESDVVLLLSRVLKTHKAGDRALVEQGVNSITDLVEPNTMRVTCKKHRWRGSAHEGDVLLSVDHGLIRGRTTRSGP